MIDEKKLIADMEKLPFIHGRYDKKNANPHFISGVESMYEMIKELIKSQPKVGEWIPCSEWMSCNARLPKYGEDVEVTTKDGDRLIGHYAGGCWYDSIDWNYIRVAAWKEPSEPWEGE